MKLFTKLAISMVAVASMAQADVTLVGVDGGLTVLGLRVGGYAGLTVGTRPVSAPAGVSTTCGTVVQTTTTTTTTNPCSYVCGPCEVVAPPKPACPAPKDPCDPCAK
jgi:hypothetical protein